MQVCTSLQADNRTSTPLLSFLQAGCPSCHPTNSVKANTHAKIYYAFFSRVHKHNYFNAKQHSKIRCTEPLHILPTPTSVPVALGKADFKYFFTLLRSIADKTAWLRNKIVVSWTLDCYTLAHTSAISYVVWDLDIMTR